MTSKQLSIFHRTAELLRGLGLAGWRVAFVPSFPEKEDGLGWCSASAKRIEYPFALLEQDDAEIYRIICHEAAHALCMTYDLDQDHGSYWNAIYLDLCEGGAERVKATTNLAALEKMRHTLRPQ